MSLYNEQVSKVKKFIKEQNLSAYDLQRIAKDLCCCGSCRFFVQHYSKELIPVDFGHCTKGNIPHCKKPSTVSCGSWDGENG